MATDTYATTVKFGSTTLETGKQYVVTGTSSSQTVEEASTSETTGFIHWDSTTHTMELDNVSFTDSNGGSSEAYYNKYAVQADGDVTIHLTDANSITETASTREGS